MIPATERYKFYNYDRLFTEYGLTLAPGACTPVEFKDHATFTKFVNSAEPMDRLTGNHWLVARYLFEHPEVEEEWSAEDFDGEIGYYEVLDLAEELYLGSEAKEWRAEQVRKRWENIGRIKYDEMGST